MSIGQFVLIINWLVEGRIKEKLNSFIRNPLALLISSFYFLHLLGLFHTSDFQYALKDLRIKIPLLLLPLVISTTAPLLRKEFNLVIYVFLGAVVSSSLVTAWLVIIENVSEPKLASPFISHIRLSLLLCIAIAYSLYFAWKQKPMRGLFGGVVLWLIVGLLLLEAFTGILIFAALLLFFLLYTACQESRRLLKTLYISLAVLFPLAALFLVSKIAEQYFHKPEIQISTLPLTTDMGNPYTHSISDYPLENGRYTGIYICEQELRSEWNKRSSISYDNLDRRKQEIKFTLIRYLTSKDLTKDSIGVWQLQQSDIDHIETGIANYHYAIRLNPYKRILEFFWEYSNYKNTGNPSGHSAMQRLEYWKTAKEIFAANWLFGVGTGDVRKVFNTKYEENNSPLQDRYRLRAHNQFLTTAVTFGIPGLLLFLLILIYPAWSKQMFRNYFFATFFIVAVLSMLNEDTLETQAGVSFFAFFFNLLLLGYPETIKKEDEEEDEIIATLAD